MIRRRAVGAIQRRFVLRISLKISHAGAQGLVLLARLIHLPAKLAQLIIQLLRQLVEADDRQPQPAGFGILRIARIPLLVFVVVLHLEVKLQLP